jgi:hypothetical protein
MEEWEIILLMQNAPIEEREKRRILRMIRRENRILRRMARIQLRKQRILTRVVPNLA